MANPQESAHVYSLVDLDCEDQDPEIERFMRAIFPRDVHDFDPSVNDVPITARLTDSDDPRDDKIHLSTTSVPPLDHVVPEFRSETAIPEPIRALYAMPSLLRELKVDAVQHYESLREKEPRLAQALPPRGHMDGGSMATTTDRLDILFGYREFTPEERAQAPRLRVADDTVHIPKGFGYIKIGEVSRILEPPKKDCVLFRRYRKMDWRLK